MGAHVSCNACCQPAAGATGVDADDKVHGSGFESNETSDKEKSKEYEARMKFLEKVPLMKRLPRSQHPLVASAFVQKNYRKGDTVIKQGDNGDAFFVIRSGQANVSVSKDGGPAAKVATLNPGDYFGEASLLDDEPRTATVTAENTLITLKISRQQFQELGLHEKLQFANRQAVGAGQQRQVVTKPPTAKTPQDVAFIEKALKDNKNLAVMVDLTTKAVNGLIEAMWKEDVVTGQELITEGDLNADYFYIVAEGSFSVSVKNQEGSTAKSVESMVNEDSKVVSTIGKGGSFGELALLYLVPRAATVKAKEKSVVYVIDRGNFKQTLMQVSDEKITEYIKYLGGVQILEPLLQEEMKQVARALVEMQFSKGDTVLVQGQKGSSFYILYEGSVSIVKDGQVVNELTASVDRGTTQYFGELALLDSEVRQATVKVTSDTAKSLVLDRSSFETLLGSLKDIISASKASTGRSAATQTDVQAKALRKVTANMRDVKIIYKDLKKIGLLGCGGFGTVELYEHEGSGETFALKSLSKGYIVKTGMQGSVMNEKNILLATNSPFIIRLHETYNSSQCLHFLMEAAMGGELYSIYNRKSFHGSMKHAKYYISGVVFAFEHLHQRHIIYRDLKPENLLLTATGAIKVTDMGLAKFVIGKTFTTCGTPDYFAPELIATVGHTNALDWWTLGILVYELMSGHPPFESPNPMQIYGKVQRGIGAVRFPQRCQGETEKFVKSLLKKEPSMRLPMRPGGTQNIKDHAWFQGFDWKAMEAGKLTPPYVPVVKSNKDISNFSARKEDCPQQIPYKDKGDGWDAEFATA